MIGDVITAAQLNLLPIQIADSTASTSVASFDFTSLPSQFAHLMIVLLLREDDAIGATSALFRLNNDSATNYNCSYVGGNNNLAGANQGTLGVTSLSSAMSVGSTGSADKFAATVLWIPAYNLTTAQKFVLGVTGVDVSDTQAATYTRAVSGTWKSTASINRVTILPNSGNFVAGSRCTIYGLA